MKTVLLILCSCYAVVTHAQYDTGDSQLNSSLVQIDAQASVNFSLFKSDMSQNYNVPEAKITTWSVQFAMKAGDIFFALELARIARKPIDDVVKIYTSNRKKGWGAIAKDLGIKPVSPEFHALKGNASGKASKGKGQGNSGKAKGKKN